MMGSMRTCVTDEQTDGQTKLVYIGPTDRQGWSEKLKSRRHNEFGGKKLTRRQAFIGHKRQTFFQPGIT